MPIMICCPISTSVTGFNKEIMKKLVLFSLTGILLIHAVSAQNVNYARKVIEDLSGPSMHGRGFTCHGIDKAARYVKKEFKNNGALPVNGSYNQWLQVNINTFPCAVKLSVNNSRLKPVIEFLPDPSSPGLKGTYNLIGISSADILSGKASTKIQYADQDQLIYLNTSGTDSLSKEQKMVLKNYTESLKRDGSVPAAGFIETVRDKLTWYSSGQCYDNPWIMLHHDVHIDTLSVIKMKLINRFLQERKARNLIGYIKGTQKPDSFITLIAHYDHLGSLGKKIYFPGANDNASGMAMLLSLMKYFSANPPAFSLLFLATTAEESGFLGSRYYVEHPVIELNKMRFLLNFDLEGTGEEGIMVVNGSIFQQEFERLVHINKRDSLLPAVKIRGEACNSDHCPFYLRGVPCFYIYTLGGNAAYHDLFDTADALSMATFENYARLMIRFIEEM